VLGDHVESKPLPAGASADTLAPVSSLATASRRDPSGPRRTAQEAPGRLRRIRADAVFWLALGGALTAFVFVTGGGSALGPNTWAQIVLLGLAIALAAAVVLLRPGGRAWGGVTLALFAAVAALTAVSISWSVQPAESWLAANQTLSYFAAFAAAVALVRLFPDRWPALLGAIAVLATIVSAYALLVKVFPASLDRGDLYGRLNAPFDYWNATGLIAAMGVPACLWAGAGRESGRAARTLSVPALAVLVAVVVLSYSRGALVAVAIGLAFWFVLAPLRLRGALVLALGAAGGAAISVWALATHPLTRDYQTLQSRTTAGHHFGLVLIVVLALSTVAGFAAAFWIERVALSGQLRRRIGTALIVLVALVPVAGIGAIATSSRGLTNEVSHLWNTLTSPNATVNNAPGRLLAVANSRALYWREAIKVGEHAPLAGVGADGYGTARTRYTSDPLPVGYAHGYVVQTFADFGLIGLALSLALLIAWSVAAGRSVGARARFRAPPEVAAEHAGLLTLLAVVIVFGVHSTIDWTWFVPGTAVPALVCAGWLAGRGPLGKQSGRGPDRRRLAVNPGAGIAVVGLLAFGFLAAWAIWQPLRSADADAAAVNAWSRLDTAAALSDARAANKEDPLSVDPLLTLSSFYTALSDPAAARSELTSAVELQPQNPQTWLQLGCFDLGHDRQTRTALFELQNALQLDLPNADLSSEIAQCRAP
jgi:O-antigen ligase